MIAALEWIGSAGVLVSILLYVRHTATAAVIGMLANLAFIPWGIGVEAWGVVGLNILLFVVNVKNYVVNRLLQAKELTTHV